MGLLLPRLPGPAAEALLEQYLTDGFNKWPTFNPDALPAATRYTATGGTRAKANQLSGLRRCIVEVAGANGFGDSDKRGAFASFDADIAVLLAGDQLFAGGEALRDDVWTFVGVSIAPDIVHWRFGTARERYLGGVRNTFQRLWMRSQALDRGSDHVKRWQLLEELTEDALVQITERPSLGGDPVLARAIAEAWLQASLRYGRRAMEPLMRWVALRVRVWNETRSLSDLPPGDLATVLRNAFKMAHEVLSAPTRRTSKSA